jgi:putative FmdB family regulatory protein
MPIFEYVCHDCGTQYEKLVMSKSAKIACPKCASGKHTQQLSVFNASGKSNGSAGTSSMSGSSCACTPKSCGCH